MASLALLGSFLLAFSPVRASTVVQTQTSMIAGTITPTPTPTPSYSSSSSSCNFLGCGSSSCIPSTTELIEYVCDNTCLNSSTFTYTVTTYPPPVTATMPCGGRFGKREPEPEQDLEKRFTCPQGPTITSTTSMACSDCHQFPTLTTLTKSSLTTIYTSCGQYSSSSATTTATMTSVSPTKTSTKSSSTKKGSSTKKSSTSSTKTSIKTSTMSSTTTSFSVNTGTCWNICYDSAGTYTTLPGTVSATPTGYVRCVRICS